MTAPGDDFLDALTYQVKEEVIGNYLRERLVIEEEISEYQQALVNYAKLGEEVREVRDDLACLLVTPKDFQDFFRILGFNRPPLARFAHKNIARGPACPLGLTPKGFTRKSKYVSLALETYGRLAEKAIQGRAAAEALFSLAVEINEDIRKFHLNYDLMSIIAFLRSMDEELLSRMKVLGDNFSPAELGTVEASMTIRKLTPRADGVRAWPELPPRIQAQRLAIGFLRDLFRREREAIVPALARKKGDAS